MTWYQNQIGENEYDSPQPFNMHHAWLKFNIIFEHYTTNTNNLFPSDHLLLFLGGPKSGNPPSKITWFKQEGGNYPIQAYLSCNIKALKKYAAQSFPFSPDMRT